MTAIAEKRCSRCQVCNKALGGFGDSVDRLAVAIAYLKEHA